MAICGDEVVTPPEECDDANQTNGDGCDSCKFTCLATDPTRDCTPADACAGQGICSNVTHICSPGTPLPNGTPCPGGVCIGGACTPSVCGNGAREPGEQCDDGNTTNLDGCDAGCDFEQNQRVNYLEMLFVTDAFCTLNQLGGAIVNQTAKTAFQTTLTQNVANGTIDTFFKLMGLEDLTGTTNDASIVIGAMLGAPVGTLPTTGLDWWHTVDPASIDPDRNPTGTLPGSIMGGVLNAGPGTIVVAGLKATSAKFTISVGAPSVPLTSAGGPPGHLASEHLDPALQSFTSTGQPNTTGAGKLCGNVSAASLATIPVPAALVNGPFGPPCTQTYALTNTLLDVLVSGCNLPIVNTTLIKVTQPDTVDPAAPPGGAGAPYSLAANAAKTVTTCRDRNGTVVALATCLNAATYSSAFKFSTERIIVK